MSGWAGDNQPGCPDRRDSCLPVAGAVYTLDPGGVMQLAPDDESQVTGEHVEHDLQLELRFETGSRAPALKTGGCLTAAAYPDLLRALKAAANTADAPVIVDLRGARHLDPDVLLSLRALARGPAPLPLDPSPAQPGHRVPAFSLVEPAELPICLSHVGTDGAVLTRLATGTAAGPAGCTISHGPDEPAGGPHLCEYLDGTLDPASTVRALTTESLEKLIDALFTHLDTPAPSFAARTWFDLATEECHTRH